jgi:hypothetical protein
MASLGRRKSLDGTPNIFAPIDLYSSLAPPRHHLQCCQRAQSTRLKRRGGRRSVGGGWLRLSDAASRLGWAMIPAPTISGRPAIHSSDKEEMGMKRIVTTAGLLLWL